MLQRVLMAHEDIFSISEPWLLLPQVYSLRREGNLSEYSSFLAHKGITNFVNHLPLKQEDYDVELRNFIFNLYHKQCREGEQYFLDKTPRYYLIIDDIFRLFPDAKFIFLFRNPVNILSSMLQTWGNNGFKSFLGSYNDLVLGFEMLSEGYNKYKGLSIKVNYESFTTQSETELTRILNYLDLKFDKKIIHDFSNQNLEGELGDPTGGITYDRISKDGLKKWKLNLNTRFRKKIAYKIINKIPESSLLIQGYNKQKVLNEIKELKTTFNIKKDLTDFFYYNLSYVTRKLNLQLILYKNFKWIKSKIMT